MSKGSSDDDKLFAELYDTNVEPIKDAPPGKPSGGYQVTSAHKADPYDAYYINQFYPDGQIVADSNWKSKKPNVKNLPNSTILWNQFQLARARWSGGSQVLPREIVRHSIVNQQTQKVMWLCLDDGQKEAQWANGTDEMAALLGTENGRSAAFMIIDRAGNGLGATTISSIRVEKEKLDNVYPNHMYIRLGQSGS